MQFLLHLLLLLNWISLIWISKRLLPICGMNTPLCLLYMVAMEKLENPDGTWDKYTYSQNVHLDIWNLVIVQNKVSLQGAKAI